LHQIPIWTVLRTNFPCFMQWCRYGVIHVARLGISGSIKFFSLSAGRILFGLVKYIKGTERLFFSTFPTQN
jgi:hypothetical protein